MFEFKSKIFGGVVATIAGKFGLTEAEPDVGINESCWFEIDSIHIGGFWVDVEDLAEHVIKHIEEDAFDEIKRITA